jgi:hypothetical protein
VVTAYSVTPFAITPALTSDDQWKSLLDSRFLRESLQAFFYTAVTFLCNLNLSGENQFPVR